MNNEKKKTLLVTALAVVLIGVGAFQFVPKGASAAKSAPKTSAVKDDKKTDPNTQTAQNEPDPQQEALKAMVKDPLPKRDPFQPGDLPEVAAPTTVPTPPVAAPSQPNRTGTPHAGSGVITHPLPPVDPGRISGNFPSGNVTINPGAPLRTPGEFAYKVTGVISGPKPMAVFEDDGGNQRLVPVGGSIDGDSRVVGIENGKVHIRHRGKDQTLTLSEGQ